MPTIITPPSTLAECICFYVQTTLFDDEPTFSYTTFAKTSQKVLHYLHNINDWHYLCIV